MKRLLAVFLTLFTSVAGAEVLEVNIWKPAMGGAAATMAAAKQAAAIINENGGSAGVGVDLNGSMHFVTNYDNWAAWAAMNKKLEKNEAWNAFVSGWIDNPSAELTDNLLLNTAMDGDGGSVYQVFVWEALPGRMATLFQSAAKAKALHEKDGAGVTVYTDQMSRMHYVMNFDSWDDWAKFQDAAHPEFDAFMQEAMADPSGRLVNVYTASME